MKIKSPESPAEAKDAAKKKHRTRGSNRYTYVEKGACLAILEFFDGDYSRAARVLGINPKTLKTYKQEITEGLATPETERSFDASASEIMKTFMRLFEVSCALTLARSPLASISQMTTLINVVGEKMIALQAVIEKRAPVAAPVPAAVEAQLVIPVEAVPSPEDEAERVRWESVVDMIMTESNCSRTKAVKTLVAQKPEAKKYLKSSELSLDDIEVEGGLS